jgi:hypothetical protein
VKQRVGLTDIEIDYARPNKNDARSSAASSLRKIWRTARMRDHADQFSDAVKIGDKEVPPVSTASSPSRRLTSGTVIFSKDTKAQAGDYKQENDAARVRETETLPTSDGDVHDRARPT